MTRDNEQPSGLSLAGLLIVLGIIIGLLALGAWQIGRERARVRDAVRIAQLTEFSAAMHLLYSDQGSYASAAQGCAAVGATIDTCRLTGIIGSIADLRDPGRYSYSIVSVPNANGYAVSFALEQGYGSFVRGRHVLTQDGIQ